MNSVVRSARRTHRHTRRALRAVAVSLALVSACRGGEVASSDVVRTDSAGVRLITSGARDTVLPWTFKEIDVLRDSLGEPWLFTNVLTFHVLADRAGRTYVMTRDPAVIRFGRDGRYERTIGRKGGGPGEFQFPIAIGSQADTLWVRDAAKRGLVRFSPDLSPAPDLRLDGALANAELLAFRTGGFWFRRTEYTDTLRVTSVFADTLGSEPLHRVATRVTGPVSFGCIGMPSSTPLFAPQVAMHASAPRLLVNAQPGYELWLYEGPRALASIRRPLAPHAPTEAEVRGQYPNGMTIGFGGGRPNCVVPVEELIAKQGIAPQYPFVFDVVLLPDATMWALRTPHVVRPAIVDVFNSEGIYAGTTTGMGLPLAMLPNGELLFARDDEESGGVVIVRMKGTR